MESAGESLASCFQMIELIGRQLAEVQGAVAILLAMQAASCVNRCSPAELVELRERVVSALLASPLRAEAVDGAEAAVDTFLGTIEIVRAARAAGEYTAK